VKRVRLVLVLPLVVGGGIVAIVASRDRSRERPQSFTAPPGDTALARTIAVSGSTLSSDSALERAASSADNAEPDVTTLAGLIQRALASNRSHEHELALNDLLPALVKRDPTAAGRLAEMSLAEHHRGRLLDRVARLWAAEDMASALAWAEGLQHHGEREDALTQICLQLSETDPAGAVELRARFLTEHDRYDALEDLTLRWAERDLLPAFAWVSRRPADERRDKLVARVAFVCAREAPAEAARFVVETMSPGETRDEAAISVLYQWAKQDRAGAAAWAQTFPEGPIRDRALKELALATAEAAPSGAARLVP
jgi:hypothetical protein